ncbi:Outer membrane protein C precursor [Klebsiella pneumoniae subsp. ozaenae]|uniref:Outer membrane protein C n=1 Tax=Klebsiella pneumoniae subsp. ozaenae TaxID=574 RepID=A0A377Z927_KLEPO|nr:Outer membrane protein C precursor [Klebsiella pneumoniae subsp. ozaenae]
MASALVSRTLTPKRTDEQNSVPALGRGDNAETYTGGLKYDANNIYLASQYTQTYNATRAGSLGFANKAQNFEVVAQYPVRLRSASVCGLPAV